MKKTLINSLCAVSVVAISQTALASCDDIKAAAEAGGGLEAVANTVVSGNQLANHSAANGGGFGLDMWVTAVDEKGVVCQVVNTARAKDENKTIGANIGNKSWLGSRVISAQKANTANAFSLDGFSISTANLYGLVQEGGSLYGLQHSNPVDTATAYKGADKTGSAAKFGTAKDPLKGKAMGGVNVFGGGLALYKSVTVGETTSIVKVGAIGVSGDTSCTDHAVAWRIRTALGLNTVPAGFNDLDGTNTSNLGDEMVIDTADHLANNWAQPTCFTPPAEPAQGADNLNGVIDNTN
jgi:uncharacterized protein GlcG (DUF336 family)